MSFVCLVSFYKLCSKYFNIWGSPEVYGISMSSCQRKKHSNTVLNWHWLYSAQITTAYKYNMFCSKGLWSSYVSIHNCKKGFLCNSSLCCVHFLIVYLKNFGSLGQSSWLIKQLKVKTQSSGLLPFGQHLSAGVY